MNQTISNFFFCYNFIEKILMSWQAALLGPKGTPYRGGIFYVSISFPQTYPQEVPESSFLTPIYHLMVNSKCSYGIVSGDVQLNELYYTNSLDCYRR